MLYEYHKININDINITRNQCSTQLPISAAITISMKMELSNSSSQPPLKLLPPTVRKTLVLSEAVKFLTVFLGETKIMVPNSNKLQQLTSEGKSSGNYS